MGFQPLPPVSLALDEAWPCLHKDCGGGDLHGVVPGRGQGLWDDKPVCLMHTPHPCDVRQLDVGDCWLMSAIATVAETPGAINKIFRNTGVDLTTLPNPDAPTTLVVTLYDPTNDFKPKDVAINETLCCYPDGSAKFGCRMSAGNEMWVCYLEKACAAFWGGWKAIDGGNSDEAWQRLVGCQHTALIAHDHNGDNEKWIPNGKPWPEGDSNALDNDALFERICSWAGKNYLLGAATGGGGDGVVQGHAYSILACKKVTANNGDTLELVQLRNPWGNSEFKEGRFDDDGPGWDEYPELKDAVKFHAAEDGVFWMTKDELFKYYNTIYLGAIDMKEWAKS